MEINKKFTDLGQVVINMGISDKIEENISYREFINNSLARYIAGDWGDLCESDKALNDWAINPENEPERIVARYNYPGDKAGDIYIITEWDRSHTTILHPSKY